MKTLVTGGAGYIGSVVAAELLRAGHQVVVLDNLSNGNRRAVPQGASLVVGEIGDTSALARLFHAHSFDAVLHFAAFMDVGESMQAPERYFRNNTSGTMTLVEAMLEHSVTHLVFSSSAAVYGNAQSVPIEETAPLSPVSVYGESKLLTERMLEWLYKIRNLRYASLRYFNAAGAADGLGEDHPRETHLIPLTLKVALGQRESVEIYGTDYPTQDGTCVRDYIHVTDLAAAHVLALEALRRDGSGQLIYNLGNNRGFSVREVIETVRRVTGHPIPMRTSPRRPGDPAVLVASSAKIQRELNWRPALPELEQIVSSAWEWHRKHANGYSE
ncbi:MAG: UDP-glucose 4-epimerase GalE [Acidobacteriota bacterium]|nr:UDP-glucose 4-epimerase GalE [Acidobacteriota bacterium]